MAEDDPQISLSTLPTQVAKSRFLQDLPQAVREDIAQAAVSAVWSRYGTADIRQAARLAFGAARLMGLGWKRHESAGSRALAHKALAIAEGSRSPEVDALRKELRDELYRSLTEALKPDERELLLLHYFRGMTLRDIAHQRGVDPSTLTRQRSRALAALHFALSDYQDLFR